MQIDTIPVMSRSPIANWWRALSASVATASRRLFTSRETRRLHLSETLSLGNRGYLAVVCYEQQRFLIGGTNNSVALLAQLSSASSRSGTRPEDESTGHFSNIG